MVTRFTRRCRALYPEKLERSPFPRHRSGYPTRSTLGPLGESALRTVVVEGTFAMVDSKDVWCDLRISQTRVSQGNCSAGEARSHFSDTLSVFADAAFRIRGGGGGGGGLGCIEGEPRAKLSLVICRRSGSRDSSAGCVLTGNVLHQSKSVTIRGLKVNQATFIRQMGLRCTNLVASWKDRFCLIFDEAAARRRVKGLDLRAWTLSSPRLTLRKSAAVLPGERAATYQTAALYHRETGDDVDGECWHNKQAERVAQLKDSESAAPNAYLTEWFPCGHSLLRVERGLPGVPQVLASYNLSPDAEEDGADANGRCKERKNGAGDVPTLHVLRSSKYHKVLASGFRSSGHLFNQSVCLLPQTMDIVAPRTLRFPGCVAIMYAFDIFMQLSVKDSRRASSPVQISFTSMLSLREAQALLLAYMCLTESFVASEDSCFRFVVGSHSALAELRKFVSANPKACSGLAGLRLSGKEEVMWEELEDEILHTGEEPTRAVCEESEEEEEEEEEEDDESEEDESEEDESEEDTDDDEEEESEGKDTDDEESEEDASPEESVREAVDYEEGQSQKADEEESASCGRDRDPEHDTDDEDRVIANISRVNRSVAHIGQTTGHLVRFGRGRGCHSRSFKFIMIGIRTLGLVNLRILRACGVFHSKHGRSRAVLKIPNTSGVLPEPRWSGEPTLLTDDLCVIVPDKGGPGALPAWLLDRGDCFFQLNYSPGCTGASGELAALSAEGTAALIEMSGIERAVRSESARGYEEPKLSRLYKASRRKQRCLFDVEVDNPAILDPRCKGPLYKRSRLGSPQMKKPRESSGTLFTIGDGEFFPRIEVAREDDLDESEEDMLSYPLAQYNLNLTIKSSPHRYSMFRADRPSGECGSVYEACLDEAVLLGHCARVFVTRGAQKNFDVSACLTWFYRAVHPCVPDMNVGDVMLDYEFALHGRGEHSPVYALLSHLAESCRVNSFPAHKLITLTRHRGASAWTRGADAPFHSQRLRVNTIGAFLCAQDHRLAPMLSRCCDPTPLHPSELWGGCELLPRGDEEELFLRAYSKTLGPVFEFEKVDRFPSKVATSVGDWTLMRLAHRSSGVSRYPGTAVVDGYTIAFASESPLFYLRGRGPLVQKLESVAVVVESGSLYRTNVLKEEDPEWPLPDPIDARERVKCKNKSTVINGMFMRPGGRDPLEGHEGTERSWNKLTALLWTFKKAPGQSYRDRDWETEYPVSESLTRIGPHLSSNCGAVTVKWLCDAPPVSLSFGPQSSRMSDRGGVTLGCMEIDSRMARIRDPDMWRGFDVLCSRLLVCPSEKVWTRGVCKVTNKGLCTFGREALVPIANLIVIVEPGEWYASPRHDIGDRDATATVLKGKQEEEAEEKDPIVHREVCSASEFIAALACRMLSGKVHEELEIKCLRRGVYNYLQRALTWFAGATGPFRSRTVTVFTPEADSATEPWTHTLPPDLDVLKTSSTRYLVSCEKACGNPRTLKLSVMRGEPGVHAVIKTPIDGTTKGDDGDCEEVHVHCDRSLREFCKLHRLPRGIRGPETWKRPLPWSKKDPGSFCSKMSELKYRWESGRIDLEEALARDTGGCRRFWGRDEQLLDWKRCSDGKLIPRRARFWCLIDSKESLARQREAQVSGHHKNIREMCNGHDDHTDDNRERDSLDKEMCKCGPHVQGGEEEEEEEEEKDEEEEEKDEEEKDEEEDEDDDKEEDDDDDDEDEEEDDDKEEEEEEEEEEERPGGNLKFVTVSCEWGERGVKCFMLLNSFLEIEFVPDPPAKEGHVFFEPVHNKDYKNRVSLDNEGRLVKYYKPHNFSLLMYDVYTVLLYGCGLTPVFEHGSSDAAGDRVLRLVVGTLAVADRLSPDVHPKHSKIVIVVREGREQTVKVARELSRCIVAATARRKRAGALEYTFKELPSNLEREVSRCPSWTAESEESAAAAGAHYALPEKFIGETGISAFAQLTTLWPSVSKRSDVKHPACSQDPRWIGVMVCLAEWEGRKQISDTVALGALEALLRARVLGVVDPQLRNFVDTFEEPKRSSTTPREPCNQQVNEFTVWLTVRGVENEETIAGRLNQPLTFSEAAAAYMELSRDFITCSHQESLNTLDGLRDFFSLMLRYPVVPQLAMDTKECPECYFEAEITVDTWKEVRRKISCYHFTLKHEQSLAFGQTSALADSQDACNFHADDRNDGEMVRAGPCGDVFLSDTTKDDHGESVKPIKFLEQLDSLKRRDEITKQKTLGKEIHHQLKSHSRTLQELEAPRYLSVYPLRCLYQYYGSLNRSRERARLLSERYPGLEGDRSRAQLKVEELRMSLRSTASTGTNDKLLSYVCMAMIGPVRRYQRRYNFVAERVVLFKHLIASGFPIETASSLVKSIAASKRVSMIAVPLDKGVELQLQKTAQPTTYNRKVASLIWLFSHITAYCTLRQLRHDYVRMGDSPEDMASDGIYVFDGNHVGFRLSQAPILSDKRDFVDRVIRAGPEESYDALVQFGYAPITGVVNLQWKREALEKYNAERLKHSSATFEKLLKEYTEKRQSDQKAHSKQKPRSKGSIEWKVPICMQKKKDKKNGVNKERKQ
ncbi:Flap endonuclease 1 [Collichthys lucidus]|uniref:Flap endonuclease 1 n=1 Tax=Collichthys lucidus TaxID=240159 RepID=A0A4U5TW85_COLLU|nr:Flap endonuclease 1 [Collichthys lucidus]